MFRVKPMHKFLAMTGVNPVYFSPVQEWGMYSLPTFSCSNPALDHVQCALPDSAYFYFAFNYTHSHVH